MNDNNMNDSREDTRSKPRYAEVAVGIEVVREHYRLLNQIKVPTANNPQEGLEHGDKEQENFQGGEENYLDNSDVDTLNEEVLEDEATKLKTAT
ncbi:hypothetical protein Tco_1323100, partial [Tanacetum coccineum]